MPKPIKVAVCGGGRGGTALAADLTFMGCRVNLFELPRFAASLEAIRQRGGVELTGDTQSGKTGLARFNAVTTDAEEAVRGVDLILLPVPAFGHQAFFEAIAPHLRPGQSILVNTCYWACLRFAPLLKKIGIFDEITLAEALILPYASNVVGPAQTFIHRTKKQDIALAAFPATKTDQILEMVWAFYPQHKKAPNVLWTNLGNLNTPIHAPLTIPIAGMLFDRFTDGRQGGAKFYGEATTPGALLVAAYDRERLAIGKALGVELQTEEEMMFRMYGYKGKDLADAMRKSEHADMFTDVAFHHGLLLEDLRYFYVSMAELGEELGIPTPVTRSILTVMSTMVGIDYTQEATTLKDIGLAGLSAEEMVRFVTTGKA
ncbi:MAG: NAD/NADP octopine/nopaline dehydrogenase family protein [Planctomycetota bacterium]|nr:NAD/NADP octopine/nopaline dehydrogenase family protein [Planctomycetota bacterium]